MDALKFVDLVRNYTDTAGTGPFALGEPVAGFDSFVERVSPGEEFYYSAIGIDHPREREVGRGTLLHGGQIERAPIAGAPTNFSGGRKAIALISSAEWFDVRR